MTVKDESTNTPETPETPDTPANKVEDAVKDSAQEQTAHIESMQRNGASPDEIMAELKAMPDRMAQLVNESVTDALKPLTRAAQRAAQNASKNEDAPDKETPDTAPVTNPPVKRGRFAGFFDGNKW